MIEVSSVTKRFGDVLAVDDVSFAVPRGVVAGFVGPNGAGKSTLMKIMATFSQPTSGRLVVAGHDVVREPLAVRRELGYLPEHNALYDAMRVDRFLDFVARARGVTGARKRERLEWVIDACSLELVLGRRIHQCSKGFRQRVGLAAALVHDPRVLLLDEPTHGLDPLQVVAFREFIRELAAERTVLFSSHIMSEVETISDRILVINRGRLLADDTVGALRERAGEGGLESLFVELVERAQRDRGAAAPAEPRVRGSGGPMNGAWIIARREVGAYFDSVIAYVYTIVFLVLVHAIFMNDFFLVGAVDMTPYFESLPLLLAFFLPAVTMRLWSEELDMRTFELLMTLPMRAGEVLLGKYLAALALFALTLVGSFPIVVMLAALGDPDLGLIAAGYLGAFLLGGLFLAVGMFMSGLTRDQIVAFVLSAVTGVFLVLVGADDVVAILDGLLPGLGTLLYESISVRPHYDAFVRGVVDLASVFYFTAMSALFLVMNRLTLRRHVQ